MLKFKTDKFPASIEPVEVQGERGGLIILMDGERVLKEGHYRSYFDSWGDARNYMLARLRAAVNVCKNNLSEAELNLALFEEKTPIQAPEELIRKALD